MQFPALTAVYAAMLAFVLVALSGWVIAGRGQFKINLGEGDTKQLIERVRAHANFVEYAPFVLLLVALLEASHLSRFAVHALLLPLLVARCLHPFGLMARPGSIQQMAFRGGSTVVTLAVLTISAMLLLVRSV